MRVGARTSVARKLAEFVKTAQADLPIKPKIDDDSAPKEDSAPAGDDVPALPGDGGEGVEEENLEEGAEEKKEVELEDVAESLDEVKDSLADVVEALEDQKDILEGVVTDTTKENFDDFKDDTEEIEEEDLSPEEFGLDVDELILSKKESGMKSLREARKDRLARTMKDEFDEPASTKKKFDPINPTAPITTVKKSEIPDMLKVALVLNDAKNAWTVVDASQNDKPLYTIACDEKTATEAFAKQVILDLNKLGMTPALKKYKATAVETALTEKKAEEKVAEEKVAEEKKVDEKTAKTAMSEYKRRFDRAFRLALTAMHKNLTKSNPLKASMFEALEAYGIKEQDASRLIEAAFAIGAVPHFETALSETDKYLDMSDEAFVETESAIGDMVVKPVDIDNTPAISEKAKALQMRAAKASVPVTTASASDPTDRMSQLDGVLPRPKLAGISKVKPQ